MRSTLSDHSLANRTADQPSSRALKGLRERAAFSSHSKAAIAPLLGGGVPDQELHQ